MTFGQQKWKILKHNRNGKYSKCFLWSGGWFADLFQGRVNGCEMFVVIIVIAHDLSHDKSELLMRVSSTQKRRKKLQNKYRNVAVFCSHITHFSFSKTSTFFERICEKWRWKEENHNWFWRMSKLSWNMYWWCHK